MNRTILQLIRKRVLIADGGVGTELQWLGLEPGACAELWNLKYPEKVKAIHRAYVEAGADFITTNSFRGNRVALSQYGLESQVRNLNLAAARLAREAAIDKAIVMGSIGPLGKANAQDAFDVFIEQARMLVEGNVDAIIIETMTATDELEVAVKAAREAGASTVIATVAFNKAEDGYETMTGTGIRKAVEAMMRAGADVIGSNCGANLAMEDYARIVKAIRSVSDKPVIAQPNAGPPEIIEGRIVYNRTPEMMAADVESLVGAGANIVGGCCGTRPEHTRLFAEKLVPSRD